MALIHTARHSLRRWQQLRALRRYFSRQPLVARSCPLCRASEPRLLVCGDRDFLGIHTSQCEHCGFIFSSPYYAEKVIEAFYREGYRTLFKGQPDPRVLTARQSYLTARAAFYARWLAAQHLLPPSGGLVLDVGCGEGTLLRTLRAERSDLALTGVEPTVSYARHVSTEDGITVAGDVSALPPDRRFDLVVSIHVLEHVYDPVDLLSQLRDRLSDRGVLYVDVPDVAVHASIVDLHLAHCNHFSVHTLRAALERAGLTVGRVVAHQPPTLPPSVFATATRGPSPEVVPGAVSPDPDRQRVGRRLAAIDVGRASFLWRSARALIERRWAASYGGTARVGATAVDTEHNPL